MPRARPAVLLFAFAALSLGGCNLVMSKTPVFTAADAAGAPVLKPGIWVAPDKDCDFDPTDDPIMWPDCEHAAGVGTDAVFDPANPNDRRPYVLASGDPRVLQFYVDLATLHPSSEHVGPQLTYIFFGVKPRARNSAGQITSAEVWFIQCGPPPPKNADGTVNSDQTVTAKPLPGMTMNDKGCTPADKAAVHGAAGPSRAWDADHKVYHWFRDH